MATTPPQHLTKTQVALQSLRELIRAGEMRPGERLRVEQLTTQLNMSPTPIREALRLLEADRLVEFRPHHGVVVSSPSPEETFDLFRVRALTESTAVRWAVERITDEDCKKLWRLHDKVQSAVKSGRGLSVSETNGDWHWAIYTHCGSDHLIEIIRRLWDTFPWRTVWAIPGRSERSVVSHEAIMKAIESRDAEEASKLMYEHVLGGVDTVIAQLEDDRTD